MESLPVGLTLKKKKKKNQSKKNETNNIIVNEIIQNQTTISLLIKTTMEKYNYFPKTNYFTNTKNEDIFPDNYIFSKTFPNLFSYFENLDQKFSEDNKTNTSNNKDIKKILKKYILDQSFIWNPEIISYIGYYWDKLDTKIKIHTIIFLSMVKVFIEKENLNDYDKNILYWAILFHDVGKFHEMNTIYKEDYSKNKFIDKSHPFKSGIIFIQTSLKKNLIFFKDENEKKDFIDFFEKQFIKALYESFEKEENKYNNLAYSINFKNINDIIKFLFKLKIHKENIWIYQIMILILFHQSLPNNNPALHGRHINEPLLEEKYIKELFDVHLLELMRIILIYDSSSHCLLSNSIWEQEIDKYFNSLIKNNYLSSEKKENKEIKKNNNIVYLAELDGDIDDIIAAEYLYNNNVLKCIVCDPIPNTNIGKMRENELKKLGIEINYQIPEDTDIVFCGGALTLLAKFIENHKISTLVMNGGFVGDNIVPKIDVLEKFVGKKTMRTFNFNYDVESTDKVLRSSKEKIGEIILVGKNVCHSKKNTSEGIWNYVEYDYLFSKYKIRKEKCLHDLLMCHEGLCLLNLLDEKPYCIFEEVYPFNNGLDGEMTNWGSQRNNNNTPYRKVLSAIKYA